MFVVGGLKGGNGRRKYLFIPVYSMSAVCSMTGVIFYE